MITKSKKQVKSCDDARAVSPDGLDNPCKQSPIEDRALLRWIWLLVLASYLARLDVGDDVAKDVADNRT
jgi:hypothetical protein